MSTRRRAAELVSCLLLFLMWSLRRLFVGRFYKSPPDLQNRVTCISFAGGGIQNNFAADGAGFQQFVGVGGFSKGEFGADDRFDLAFL